jgi:hypothetical protein
MDLLLFLAAYLRALLAFGESSPDASSIADAAREFSQ